jgi:hypothetical protein
MFQDKMVAANVNDTMLQVGRLLDASLAQTQSVVSAQEFEAYRIIVARLLGEMLLEVMNPIYQTHPELKPDELA